MQYSIPKNFILGAASSAWQTEGWSGKKDGQDSYLDAWFKSEHFVWHKGYGPDIATNFMHQFPEDVALMADIHLTHYRTSINWSRFFTDYENLVVDEDYAQHIDDVINALLAAGVEPMICLEHYELPKYLMDKYDGWSSKKVIELYVAYAEIVFKRYGDRVKHWFTFNEPIVVQTRVYLDALRWPHEQNPKKWMLWNFHKTLATAKVIAVYRSLDLDGRVGCILNPEMVYPRSSSAADQAAAHYYDLLYNKVFFDPMVKGVYPDELIHLCRENDIYFDPTAEELQIIKDNTVDFLGINQYYPKRVKSQRFAWRAGEPFHPSKYYEDFDLPGKQMNSSRGWEIYPQIMYDMAMYLTDNYPDLTWLVAENGMGREQETDYKDTTGVIQDDYRIDFIGQHLSYLLKAVDQGAKCEGYMLWAFTDCVSPMNAFKNRYGLVEIDLENGLKRQKKASANWYRSLITDRVLTITEK
ncbi:glycoside hydrolase family 1 protein [Aerococcus agrisoli]|uniref:Glycoside hydrolase family 1 protein n=1 Tax=Aerococcus agrisoli TaxID=2487350 RepID=A0A3N4H160_9LACT|nr:glycoside hydrolase family 1 protein [Aerococcus agrisoli]RPA65081.1 glycoside hydrolase family 1 protein [Aerococcus agrisoli]